MATHARLTQAQDLDAIELIRVRVPLLEPFVASHGTETERDVVLVRVIGAYGASEGWGECSTLSEPSYTSEFTDGAWTALRDELAPAALDGAIVDLAGHRMAWAAIEDACVDHGARTAFRGRRPFMGIGTRDTVRCGAVVGRAASIDALLSTVAARVAEGFVQIKLKIGPGWDLEPLRAVRAAWPDLALAADANGSYALDDLDVLHALDDIGLAYLEQPLRADDLQAHATLRARLATPIALDESIECEEDLRRAIALGALDVVNVKPGRVGGYREVQAISRVLVEHALPAFVGGMLETGVGRAFALQCAAMPVFTLPTDLGPSSRYFADDITEPFVMAPDGTITLTDGHGCGAVVRPDRLEQVTVARALVEPVHRRARLLAGPAASGSAWPIPASWAYDDPDPFETATAGHALDPPTPAGRVVRHHFVMQHAIVLGSTQRADVIDRAALRERGIALNETGERAMTELEVVTRRSGGGAVLLCPLETEWIDLVVPRGDVLWDDDVNRSFLWLGETWVRALGALGLDAEVHRGALERTPWSELVCFAGLGPGEVTVDGCKAVGLSQRRTREAATFHCVAYVGLHDLAARIVDHLALPADAAERDALRHHLTESVFTIPARSVDLLHAFFAALPA